MAGSVVLSIAFAVLLWILGDAAAVVSDAGLLAVAGFAAVAAGARVRRADPRCRRSWRLIAACAWAWTAGQALWVLQRAVGDSTPVLSISDAGYLAMRVLAVAAILALPVGDRLLRRRTAFDALVPAGASLFLSWALILAVVDEEQLWSSAANLLVLAYPVAYLTVSGYVLLYLARWRGPDLAPFVTVSAGLGVTALVSVPYATMVVAGTYATGHPIDAAWFLCFALIATGARMAPTTAEIRTQAPGLAQHAVPYVAVIVMSIVVVIRNALGLGADPILSASGLLTIVFVAFRQWRAVVDNQRLAAELELRVDARTAELAARTEQLVLGEQRFRLAIAAGNLATFELDLDTRRIVWGAEMDDFMEESDAGTPTLDDALELVHPDDRRLLLDAVADLEAEGDGHCEVRMFDAGGGPVRWFELRARRIGTTSRAMGISADITAFHDALDSLAEREERITAILDSANDPYVELDEHGRITGWNHQAALTFGWQFEEIEGRTARELLLGGLTEGVPAWYQRAIDGGFEALLGAPFEATARRRDGTDLPVELTVWLTDSSVRRFHVFARDISDRRRTESELRRLASEDPLTGLGNRSRLFVEAESILAGGNAGVLLLDLDGFKDVNDGLGHSVGDELLIEVAERLRASTRPGDLVCRLGGDEFAVVVTDLGGGGIDAIRCANRILAELRRPAEARGMTLHLSGSVGVALSPDHGTDIETLLAHADLAMYRAKERRSSWHLFSPSDESGTSERLSLLGDLRSALDAGDIAVVYQPKIDLVTRRIIGVEALSRWNHPEKGPIPPSEFVPLAERTGLIDDLTDLVFAEALAQCHRWRSEGLDVDVAVNVSPRSLDAGFPSRVQRALVTAGLPSHALTIELTEYAFAESSPITQEVLLELRASGVRLSIDDFGTGYSSLGYLKSLPVNELKIDRSFVTNLEHDRADAAIVRAVLELADSLGLSVVAEGVETEGPIAILRGLGCRVAQGYHFYGPLPATDVTALLAAENTSDDERGALHG